MRNALLTYTIYTHTGTVWRELGYQAKTVGQSVTGDTLLTHSVGVGGSTEGWHRRASTFGVHIVALEAAATLSLCIIVATVFDGGNTGHLINQRETRSTLHTPSKFIGLNTQWLTLSIYQRITIRTALANTIINNLTAA